MYKQILEHVRLPTDDPRFHASVFTAIVRARKEKQEKDGDNLKRVIAEEYDELSKRIDRTGLQESVSVRNMMRTRRMANLLINDKGEINVALIPKAITDLSETLYSLGPSRQHDDSRQKQILQVLTHLHDNKTLIQLLKKIGKPHANPGADQLIRETLQLPASTTVTDAHTRRAALAAWMAYLRQNVGSCFATAPAILIHDEQPEAFLTDLNDLLATGRIKRTFGGNEYSAPLSVSWGGGDLRRTIVMNYGEEENGVWAAPGILAALEAAEVWEKELPLKDKIANAHERVLAAFPNWSPEHPQILTNAEEIIRRILMGYLEITHEDLEAYDNRPKGMIHSGLLMQMPVGMGGTGEVCAIFYTKLEHAQNAFKSMTDNALLKAWEFTLASFSETKSEFTRWNLYYSLGLKPDEPGGIGQAFYALIKNKLDEYNQRVAELQNEYEILFSQLKYLEARFRSIANDKDAQWARAEYQSKLNEFHTFEEMRNETHAKAKLTAELFDILIDAYDHLFPQYFQEVYDPDLQDVKAGPFDDSPAGFRLLYKHGRRATSQWEKVKSPSEFIDALNQFFIGTENEILRMEALESVQKDVSEMISAVISHIHTQAFLESAFYRMALAHQTQPIANPLENLDKISAKPWAYVSGGTMTTLVSAYYRREHKPTEVERWVENPMELFVFFIDSLKHIPYAMLEPFFKDPKKSLLMHSPTHAFLLKPGWSPLKEAVQAESYTYTWLRDTYVKPMERFVDNLFVEENMMDDLVEKLAPHVPVNYRHYFKKSFSRLHGRMHPCDFREYLIERMSHERGLQYMGRNVLPDEVIDSMIYANMPMFPKYQLKERLEKIWEAMGLSSDLKQRLQEAYQELSSLSILNFFGAETLQSTALALLAAVEGNTSTSINYPQKVVQTIQQLGFAMPMPLFFGDTNWTKEVFAFVMSPATRVLELWRMDPLGVGGYPMTIWKEWLNGARKDRTWGIYSKPTEYVPGVNHTSLRLPPRGAIY